MLRVGAVAGRLTCDWQSGFKTPAGQLSHNIGQPCIPRGSLNRVPALARGKGGIHTSARWQVTLCDPIWHWVSRSGESKVDANCYAVYLLIQYSAGRGPLSVHKLFSSCIRRCLVSRACEWVMSALSAVLLIFSFQFSLLFFHIGCQAAHLMSSFIL